MCKQIDRIEMVHRHDLIYRDVKPENFLIGRSHNKKDKIIHIIGINLYLFVVLKTWVFFYSQSLNRLFVFVYNTTSAGP